jgi:lysophospholipase L1-like esterase
MDLERLHTDEAPVKKSRYSTLILSACSLLVALIFAELFLRLSYPIEYLKPPSRLPNDIWRELLHRRSSVPGLAYELAPNRKAFSHGAFIRTNSFGMRDDEPNSGNDASLHRIVVIGDSFTFGFGVSGEDVYPNVLEKVLDSKIRDGRAEVLNLGVGGYSTHDEALVLEHKGNGWIPELVVIGYVLNDPETEPVQPLHMYFQESRWWQHLNMLRLVAQFRNAWEIRVLGKGDHIQYLHAHQQKWQSVVEGLDRISTIGRERRIPILLLIFPMTKEPWKAYPYRNVHQQVAKIAREKNLEMLDLYDDFSQFPPQQLMVVPGDSHPSKFANEIAARAVYQWMLANKHLFTFLSPTERGRK